MSLTTGSRVSSVRGGRTPARPVGSLRPGATLAELTLVLALTGLLLGAGVPRARRALDERAVRAARAELIGAVDRTRALALGRGAALHLAEDPPRYWIVGEDGDSLMAPVRLRNVAVELGRPTTAIRFDAMGIGRAASRTVRLSRQGVVAGLTVSAYGRVRGW